MCRFVAYLGRPIVVDEVLIKPENGLVNQSYDAEEMAEPINGDGFGLGWYNRQVRRYPGLFRSITPAWNNQNLLYNASLIRTDCFFAHVRAASVGTVAEANCHPFHYREWLMMHNGNIPQYDRIKRPLLNLLSEEFYLWVQGQTDSEALFALLMQVIRERQAASFAEIAECFQWTFDRVESLKSEHGITEGGTYNMMITNGEVIAGARYSSRPDEPAPTLYYAVGARYECRNGHSQMIPASDGNERAALIVSEKLTNDTADWKPIPPRHFIAVDSSCQVRLQALA